MRRFLCIVVCSLITLNAFAQAAGGGAGAVYSLSGTITDSSKKALVHVQVLLSLGDTLCAAALTNEEGAFMIAKLPPREYLLQIHHPGFAPVEQSCYIRGNTTVEFTLVEELNEKLDELVVAADRSRDVTRTATGQIFYPSEKAKSSGDAYKVLNEVPKLRANAILQSITMPNGTSPLILIDGNRMHGGINALDSKEIESIELMDVIPAKYLRLGIQYIINIKLKKKEHPYFYFQNFTQGGNNKLMGIIETEVGNPNFSVNAWVSYMFLFQNKNYLYQHQQDEGYNKIQDGILTNNSRSVWPRLLFKWRLTEKDYFAFSAGLLSRQSKTEGDGLGNYQTRQDENFSYHSFSRNKDYIFSGSLYHKHTFTPDKILETTLFYNQNGHESTSERSEIYPGRLIDHFNEYHNNRLSGLLNIDYTWKWNKVNALEFGSETKYVKDKINQVSENYPLFHHREWNEYLYAGFSSKLGNLRYMASVGVEGIWLTAGNASNRYVKPRLAASASYEINDHNSLMVGYSLTNTAPAVGELNPYNTSTDPLVITRGNPELLPVQKQAFKFIYTFNLGDLYIEPEAIYTIYTDMIEPFGYTENGVYTATYKNAGRFKRLSLGGTITYELNDWLSIDAAAYHYVDYFTGQEAKKGFYCECALDFSYKEWELSLSSEYLNYEYTALSYTKHLSPDYSNITLKYDVSKNFNIAASVSFFVRSSDIETITRSGTYFAYNTQHMIQRATAFLTVRYTLRNHVNRKIKLNKMLDSNEKGISL